MHIKEVNITGFRSYREATIIDFFSPKHNVIVGRNGSGKSNFFFAIQFVLSDEFSHLRVDQRQALLHEGTGPRLISAKVEIVLDNSDQRIPSDSNEVRLVRQIGAKKDQYFLDGKNVTRTDVVNLMESAGFSRSNPYYIVKQGKINELATAADSHRLKLLREVAGTRVYDERKQESLQILRDTEGKREKVEGLIKYIEDRLKTLEEEKEELKEYQKWDKMKRSLEYTIYEQELRDTRKKLDKQSEQREELHAKQNDFQGQLVSVQNAVSQTSQKLRKLDARFKGHRDERESLNAEQTERFQRKTQLELDIKDLKEDVEKERSARDRAETDLEILKREIAEKEEELEELQPRYNQLLQKETQTRTDLRILEQRCKELYSQQGHKDQFKSEADRDQFLQKEIRSQERQLTELDYQQQQLIAEIQQDKEDDETAQNTLGELQMKIRDSTHQIDELSSQHSKAKKELEELYSKTQELHGQEANTVRDRNSVDEELHQNSLKMCEISAKAFMKARDSVHLVLEDFRKNNTNGQHSAVLDGYFGCVIENFTCESVYFRAVEVTAGNSLFHHIVSTDRVGAKIMKEVNSRNLPGEVTCLPLNRILARTRNYPDNPDCRPMIQVINRSEQMSNIMLHVFGRTLIVRNIDVGTKLAKSEHIDCVSLQGDQVGHRGTMTGGYQDAKRSRLELQQQRVELEGQRRELVDKLEDFRSCLNDLENRTQHKGRQFNDIERKLNVAKSLHSQIIEQKREKSKRIEQYTKSNAPKTAQLLHLQSRSREIGARRDNYRSQLGSLLSSQPSSQEQYEEGTIREQIEKMKNTLEKVSDQRAGLEKDKTRRDNQLANNLYLKRGSLQAQVQDIAIEEKRHALDTQQSEVTSVNTRLQEIGRRLAEVEEDCEVYDVEREQLTRQLDDSQEEQKELELHVGEMMKQTDVIATKQATLHLKRDEKMRKVRELGTLPGDAFEKYQNLSVKQLSKKLNECLENLLQYENVNKKALDQFVSASEQREALSKRKDEQDRNHQSIVDLISVLDHRKYEAIQLTFKQVSKNFEEVFRKLVPGGEGRLVMRIQQPEGGDSLENGSQLLPSALPEIEKFIGIGIKVSFTGTAETREMQQLSGGQRSLVALALIFAIQKCDPAPFYLFDEIDAALDAQHRKAVADMIHELSTHAQFITTTFRPELLESAEKYYGVRFRNKVSHIDVVTKVQAYDFVEDDQTHG